MDDLTLLREYAQNDSAPAFAELVARHVDKVYSTALRHTRNALQAEEITQAVFVILAQKAGRLGGNIILSGWLYQTARLTAVTFLRSEVRRVRREQEMIMQSEIHESEPEVWLHIAPLLDDALAKLGEKDRHAVVLRFFDGKSFGEIGAVLGGSESAAKMRVNRALERLRRFFARRGVSLSAMTIASAISVKSVQSAPAVLAKAVSTLAAAKGAATASSTSILVKGTLKIMAWTKAKTAIALGAGVLLAAGTTTVLLGNHPVERTAPTVQLREPVSLPAIVAWQQGNHAEAVQRFIEADWSGRPLFASDSILSLSEGEYKRLSTAERQARFTELTTQIDLFKQLVAGVTESGRTALARGDMTQARRVFTALNQAGAALENPDCMALVQLVGKAMITMSARELSKTGN